MDVNTLVTRMQFKPDQGIELYERSMRQAQQMTQTLAGRMERSLANVGKVKVQVDGADKAQREIAGVGKAFSSLKSMVSIGLGALGIGSIGKFGFDAASEYETSMMQLTTLVGKSKSGDVLKGLQQFAAKTPYELKDIMGMFTRLEGAGFGLLDSKGQLKMETLTKLGDLASASNKPLSELTDTMLSANRGLGSMVDNFVGLAAKANGGGLAMQMFDRTTGKTMTRNIKAGDKAGILDFFTQAGTRKGIGGGMDAQSKTLAGQMSTMTDNLKNIAQQFFLGFSSDTHNFMADVIKTLENLGPVAKEWGKNFASALKFGKDNLPAIISGLVGVGAALATIKAYSAYVWIYNTVAAYQALAFAANTSAVSLLLADAAFLAIPVAIGVAVAAIAGFGWGVYKYITGGKKELDGLRKNFGWLAWSIEKTGDFLKWLWPILKVTGEFIGFHIVMAWKAVSAIFDFTWNKLLVPFFSWIWASLTTTGSWLKDWAGPWMQPVIGAFNGLWDTLKALWAWAEPFFNSFKNNLGDIGKMAQGAFGWIADKLGMGANTYGGADGQGGTGGGMSGYNAGFGGKIAQQAKITAESLNSINKCAYGVEVALQKLGINMTGHAYELKAQLDKDKRFQRVNVTDEQMKNLPPGTIVVHDRNLAYKGPGLGGKFGHVSVALGNGMEASDHIQKQMIHHYAGGPRYVYKPVGASASTSNTTVNVHVAGTNATPGQIADATQRGLARASMQNRQTITP